MDPPMNSNSSYGAVPSARSALSSVWTSTARTRATLQARRCWAVGVVLGLGSHDEAHSTYRMCATATSQSAPV